MKKTILVLALIVAVGFTFTSCKNDKKEEVKEEVGEKMASNDEIYQCPMDCEHGKSYTEAGKCPVCKMDLKAKKAGEASAEICAKCGKSKAECAKEHGDKVCAKCGKDKGECTCPKYESKKDSTNHDEHDH